jgi:thioredoxin 1
MNRNRVRAAAFLAALAAVFAAGCAAGGPPAEYEHGADVVRIESDKQFDEVVLKSDKPVLVDFYDPMCSTCREMAPVVEEVAKAALGRVVVASVDIVAMPHMVERFGLEGVPSFIVFRNGQKEKVFLGNQNEATLRKALLGE